VLRPPQCVFLCTGFLAFLVGAGAPASGVRTSDETVSGIAVMSGARGASAAASRDVGASLLEHAVAKSRAMRMVMRMLNNIAETCPNGKGSAWKAEADRASVEGVRFAPSPQSYMCDSVNKERMEGLGIWKAPSPRKRVSPGLWLWEFDSPPFLWGKIELQRVRARCLSAWTRPHFVSCCM
jgi:hypothetical protein